MMTENKQNSSTPETNEEGEGHLLLNIVRVALIVGAMAATYFLWEWLMEGK